MDPVRASQMLLFAVKLLIIIMTLSGNGCYIFSITCQWRGLK